jgi:hypothetical protein
VLKILTQVNNRTTLILGLSRDNTSRLHQGQPIPVNVQALTQTGRTGPVQDVIICAGETEDALTDELAQYLPGIRDAARARTAGEQDPPG